MSILKELVALQEADRVSRATVGIETIYAKAKHDLAQAANLLSYIEKNGAGTWHGDRMVISHEKDHIADGPVYDKILHAVDALIEEGYETEVNQHIDANDLVQANLEDDEDNGGHPYSGDAEFTWNAIFKRDEMQFVYLGYDPIKDKMYAGFDAWISEDEFNNEFDPAFKEATGLDHDMDDEAHYEVFDRVWKDYQKQGYSMWGLVFEITPGGEYRAEEAFPPLPGGFFRGLKKEFKANHRNVIDII